MNSKEDQYVVHVGPRQRLRIASRMTERDRQYLEAHNVRRKQYHEGWGKEYVPMKWSEELKRRSKKVSGGAREEPFTFKVEFEASLTASRLFLSLATRR